MVWKSVFRIVICLVMLAFIFLFLFFSIPPWEKVERVWELLQWNSGHMQIVLHARKNHQELQQIANTAYAQIGRLNQIINEHNPESEAGKLRLFMEKGETDAKFMLSEELFSLIRFALLVYKKSQGAFDITISPYISLWKKCSQENRLPLDLEIKKLQESTGSKYIHLDDREKILKIDKSLSLSLGAFVKGYAVDQVASFLKKQGIPIGMVNMGGDLLCFGPKKWKVGIQDPRITDPDAPEDIIGILSVENKAVATSGHYRRYFEIQGKRYSHILDARTGECVSQEIVSVSVLASTAILADAYATVFCIIKPRDSLSLAKELGIDALIITKKNNSYLLYETEGFEKYWEQKPPEVFQKVKE